MKAPRVCRRSATYLERPDARGIRRRVLLEVIAHVPDRAVVSGIDRGLRVILPAHRVDLGRLPACERRFTQGELAERIIGQTARESLTGERRCTAERIADSDVALMIDRRTAHPAIGAIRCVRALLPQLPTPIGGHRELVPANTAAKCRSQHRMNGGDGL